jgi:hypothetical protein
LTNAGLNVVVAGGGWGLGFLPDMLLQSLLDRAKIGLNLTLHSLRDNPTGPDPRFASCMRIAEMLERRVAVVSERLPNNPYVAFMHQAEVDDLAALCQSLLKDERWRTESERLSNSFSTEMDAVTLCRPVIDRTVALLT